MIKTLTGRGVLLCLAGFFGLIFVTNAIFITEAVKTFRGEDEQLPYLQGVAYNQTLEHRAQQARLGWQASIAAHMPAAPPKSLALLGPFALLMARARAAASEPMPMAVMRKP